MAESEITYPDITVTLAGEDGNAFAIMGAVKQAIASAEGKEAAKEWVELARCCPSYEDLLTFVCQTVNVA